MICTQCGLPELLLYVKKNELRALCKSCGKSCKIEEISKFSQFIKKYPPEIPPEYASKILLGKTISSSKVQTIEKDKEQVINKEKKKEQPISKEEVIKLRGYVEVIKKEVETNVFSKIESIVQEEGYSISLKYFLIIFGIFDKNIYHLFRIKDAPLKKVAILLSLLVRILRIMKRFNIIYCVQL